MMRRILVICGSPSRTSKTAIVAKHSLWLVQAAKRIEGTFIDLRELDPTALLHADFQSDSVRHLISQVEDAHGIIIASPVFKAAYSGLLKAALDVLPQFALAGKVVLPIVTGGSLAHVLAIDYALRPVLHSMGARHVVQGQFISDTDIDVAGASPLSAAVEAPLREAIRNFTHSLSSSREVRWLGHPRPPSCAPEVLAGAR